MASTDGQTAGIIINLVIGAVTILVVLPIFDYLRGRIPSIFEARRTLNQRRTNLDYHNNRVFSPDPPSRRCLGWIRPVFRLELETVSETHGPDIALYLRYLRFMTSLFIVLLIPTVPLLPVYFTAGNKKLPDDNELRTVGIQRFSLANLPRSDPWRFWVTLAADYLIVIVVLGFIYREFCFYSKLRRRYRASDNPANYAILVQDIPPEACNEAAVLSYWHRLFPDEVAHVHFIHDGGKLVAKKDKFWAAVTSRERAEWDLAFNKKLDGDRPTHKIGNVVPCLGQPRQTVDSIQFWSGRQNHYSSKISLYQQEIDPKYTPPTRAAIVVFKNRRTAAVAAQTNFTSRENQWRVSRAPEPNAVNWGSISIPGYQLFMRNTLAMLATVLLTLFWIVPVTLIMSLANLSNLATVKINGNTPFSFLEDVENWSPVLKGFLESTLPAIILSVFLGLIPTFIRMFLSICRIPSHASMDGRVRDWYFNFIVFSNFLFVIVSGSLLKELGKITNQPSKIISFLASSAPSQGSFIMNFIILKALSETPKELLQIGRVVVRAIMLMLTARTARQKRDKDTGNTTFQFFRYYAMSQLIGLLGLIYSTLSPFIIPCCIAYFLISYMVMKYNLCYSMYNDYQDGGRLYGGALYGVWIGLFLHLLTMIGIFGLNNSPAQSVLIVIPAVLAVCYVVYVFNSFYRIFEHGSALETLMRVEETGEVDSIDPDLAARYVHPGFVSLPEPVENLNGVDGNDGSINPDMSAGAEGDIEAPGSAKSREEKTEPNYGATVEGSGIELQQSYDQPTSSVENWADANAGSRVGSGEIQPPR